MALRVLMCLAVILTVVWNTYATPSDSMQRRSPQKRAIQGRQAESCGEFAFDEYMDELFIPIPYPPYAGANDTGPCDISLQAPNSTRQILAVDRTLRPPQGVCEQSVVVQGNNEITERCITDLMYQYTPQYTAMMGSLTISLPGLTESQYMSLRQYDIVVRKYDCGPEFFNTNGTYSFMEFPKYGWNYPDNIMCNWKFESCSTLEVYSNIEGVAGNCMDDFLSVNTGDYTPLDLLCGTNYEFRTYNSTNGFNLDFYGGYNGGKNGGPMYIYCMA